MVVGAEARRCAVRSDAEPTRLALTRIVELLSHRHDLPPARVRGMPPPCENISWLLAPGPPFGRCRVGAQSVPSKLAERDGDEPPLGALPAEPAPVVGTEGGGAVGSATRSVASL